MSNRIRTPKSTLRLNSLSLEKILRTQQNISIPSPNLWNTPHPDHHNQVNTNTLTLNHPILRILETSLNIAQFNQIHTQLLVTGLIRHPLTAGRVIKKLCSHPHSIPQAVSLLSHFDEPDAFMCNTIMRSYVNSYYHENALHFYREQMLKRFISPNHYTFPILAKTFAELGLVIEGDRIHAQIVKVGLGVDLYVKNSLIFMYSSFRRVWDAEKVFDQSPDLDLVSWNSMIDGYAKNGEVGNARMLFDDMPGRDIVSWNSMIAGYVGVNDMEGAQELFGRMVVKDVVTWNCMIDGYARIGDVRVARELFERMGNRNVVSWNTMLAVYVRGKDNVECLRLFDRMIEGREVKPNEATLVSVLTACANTGDLCKGKVIHSYMRNSEWIKPDVLLLTSLLTMYAKCEVMDIAREVFDDMQERSVVSWNSMIMGYGMHGLGEKALELFLQMEKSDEIPNGATFVCVLSACVHAGMVLEGWWYFDMMQRVYKIEPKVEHYGCMVDLLGRAGLMKDSEEFVRRMPMGAGPALWGALLSACETHSNFELGEIVGKKLIELEPSDIGPYVLLSNMYAKEGKWDDVEKVRKMMSENRLQKIAGFSLVDIAGSSERESFLEKKHESGHKKSMVYTMLSEMGAQIKLCRDGGRENIRGPAIPAPCHDAILG